MQLSNWTLLSIFCSTCKITWMLMNPVSYTQETVPAQVTQTPAPVVQCTPADRALGYCCPLGSTASPCPDATGTNRPDYASNERVAPQWTEQEQREFDNAQYRARQRGNHEAVTDSGNEPESSEQE